ncbi:MAG TPA: flagellar protein export ATPase FliI [Rhodopila sp.]|nr:flagellar protein export ATPase FliI [Rhodopila sp.]
MSKKRINLTQRVDSARSAIRTMVDGRLVGRVASVRGLVVDVAGLRNAAAIGDRVEVLARESVSVAGEVIGFHDDRVEVMTYHPVDGLAGGMPVELLGRQQSDLFPADCWLGRVIDPLGNPVDRNGPMLRGPKPLALRAAPPDANIRARVGPPIELGVRALDLFATCREGQRMGLFAGSGVGKSTLLSMLTRGTVCDVVVLALVGERGREVREFIEDDLGPEGLARSVVVVATSDTPPLMRRQCAYTAATVAEFFRDQGKSVLLLMDSVTRFCLALREISLSLGEPPATRGYPPSVFAELPKLLERAGPGLEAAHGRTGQITGLFTVLVEGDDHNEPVADAVRGILDGHIVMERRIAESGRYPAVDVLRSLSRLASTCLDEQQIALVRRARSILSLQADMIDMVRLGAYRAGTDPTVDEAVRLTPAIESLLRQGRHDRSSFGQAFAQLAAVLGAPHGA